MKILLIRTGGLGDSIVTLPVAQHIRRRFPGALLHVLGNHTMLAVARLSGIFDGLHSLDTGEFYHLYSDSPSTDFFQSFFSQFETVYFFTTAPEKKIISTVLASGARTCRVLDPRPPINSQLHIAEHLMTILGDSGVSLSSGILPQITVGRNDRQKRNGLIIHPGSGGSHKNWPLEKFVRCAGKIPDQVTFLLGPAEIELGMDEDIPKERFHVVTHDIFGELCCVLSKAERYLGNDSGVSHLASLCGTPSVVLFGPTNPAVWRPLGRNVTVVSSSDGKMESIPVIDVLRMLESKAKRLD